MSPVGFPSLAIRILGRAASILFRLSLLFDISLDLLRALSESVLSFPASALQIHRRSGCALLGFVEVHMPGIVDLRRVRHGSSPLSTFILASVYSYGSRQGVVDVVVAAN